MTIIHSSAATFNAFKPVHSVPQKPTQPSSMDASIATPEPIVPPLRASQIIQIRTSPTLYAVIQSEDSFAEENWAKKRRNKQLKTNQKPDTPLILPVVKKQT